MKAVILAASPGIKLRPFTETRAEPMVRVADRTVMENILGGLKAANLTDILVVVDGHQASIEKIVGHGHRHGVTLEYVAQGKGTGIGGALMAARSALEDAPFVMVYGDVLTTGQPYQNLLEHHAETGGCVAAVTLPKSSRDYGNVYLDQDMRVNRLVEKPTDRHLANYVFAGLFVMTPDVFGLLETHQQNMEAVFHALVAKKALSATLWDGQWIDITHPWDILEANRILMSAWKTQDIHASVKKLGQVHLEGPMVIEENVVLDSGVVLKGPCFIGAGSYIGTNTLIRENTSVGPQSIVGYGSELKNCVLFGQSKLGRLAYLGDSVIGENVDLGTGICTVNHLPGNNAIEYMDAQGKTLETHMTKLGAMIGDDVIIGARQVLAPGTHIKAGFRAPDNITLRSQF